MILLYLPYQSAVTDKNFTLPIFTRSTVHVCNGINLSVAMSQRVGRREEGRVGERETRMVRREGRRKGGRDKRRD